MVETYSWQYHVIESDKIDLLDWLIETNKFVNLWGSRVNVSNISSYYPIPSTDCYDIAIAVPKVCRWYVVLVIKEHEKEWSLLKLDALLKTIRKKYKIPLPDNWIDFKNHVISFLHHNYPNNG